MSGSKSDKSSQKNEFEKVYPHPDSQWNRASQLIGQINLMVAALETVLVETLHTLHILRTLNTRNNISFDENLLRYSDVVERFTGTEDHSEKRLPSRGINHDKLAIDINKLINVFRETAKKLSYSEEFPILKGFLNAINNMTKDDDMLFENEKTKSLEIKLLKQQYNSEKAKGLNNVEKTFDNIQYLKFSIENAIAYGRYEVNYFKKWEATRAEQNKLACLEQENVYRHRIDDTKKDIELERKCHHKFKGYIEESRRDMLDEINYLVKHYDDEIERREIEIIDTQRKLEKLCVQHRQVLYELEKRQKEMAEWKQYKRERELRRKRAKLVKWASVVIQAWWRCIMVRKRLGPYKRKKKDKKIKIFK
ncbi:uncharacterized protein LOC126891869 [Diabrotica virgifera virgifera]|uniref:Dynein regulatory complex protein 10 n=2 Tax=Diabrotica virgifera virgifera TaxID=50390 RepID=A0ABM5L3Z9_DIAVI|nr:uncharacterized protein LOC126891869 [Diabrotica virgifera virgifera]